MRDNPRQTAPPAEEQHDVIDHAADYGYDAIEFGGLEPETVVSALRDAADEIERDGDAVIPSPADDNSNN